MNELGIALIFFLTALIYSSVGFGGGSTCLALLSLILEGFYEIRRTALFLNLIVVSISTMNFARHGIFKWKLIWPFVIGSIPLSLLLSTFRLSESIFFVLLGIVLMLAAFFMIVKLIIKANHTYTLVLSKQTILGAAIGGLSGLTEIGGGIYLSPTLNLLGWESAKTVATVAAFFILCNSLAGISGYLMANTFQVDISLISKLSIAVMLGGVIGGYMTSKVINNKVISIIMGILVGIVGIKLILKTVI